MQTTTTPPSSADAPPPAVGLDNLQTLEEAQQARLRLFPGVESLRWYLRVNRKALIERGAVLHIHGRQWIDPALFDAYILEAGRSAAGKRAA